MRIDVNGAPRSIRAATLADLVAELGHEAPRVATARNGSFVPRTARATTPLTEGDRIEVLTPMQGG